MDTTGQRLYYLVYLARRTVYLILALAISDSAPQIVQIYGLIFLNLAIIIYNGLCQPMASRLDRRLELFNELMVCFSTISMLLVTDWNPSPHLQYDFGWMIIG